MPTQSFDLHELVQQIQLEAHATWRYRWYALALAWCVAIAGALLVFSLPNQYQSSAQVYADTASLNNPLLHGIAVQPDVRQRLKILTHTLKSRPNLKKVANETGLSLRANTPQEQVDLLDNLAANVQVRDAGARNLYQISYTDPNPEMSQKVVQSFLQILMNETLGAHVSSTATAQNFLQQQVQNYSQRLNKAEAQLAAFKQAHVGYIPGEGGNSYVERTQQAQAQLQTLQGEYNTAAARRATIRRQMHAMATNPGSVGLDPRIAQINHQIDAYQQTLNQLLLRYTDAYPDVVSVKRMIKQLKQRRSDMRKGTASASDVSMATDNPVYQARQQNLYTTEVAMRALGTQIGLKKRQIAQLEGKQGKAADVEASLQELTRNYQATKKQYNELVSRLNTAQISVAATQSGNNLKFRVVDPPSVPLLPASPKRGWLLGVVLAFAVCLGAAFAFFLHQIRPVFTSLRSLRGFVDVPVIGTFRMIESYRHRARKVGAALGFGAVLGLLLAVIGFGIAYNMVLSDMVQHVLYTGVA